MFTFNYEKIMSAFEAVDQQTDEAILGSATPAEHGFDPPTEELLIANSSLEARKQLLSTYIIDGYLKRHFDLDLSNPVHEEIAETLRSQGKLRPSQSSLLFI